MKSRLLGAVCASVFGLNTSCADAALIATNIGGTDGSVSLVNANPVPLDISNIEGLAPTTPLSPGDNYISGGTNTAEDLFIGDTFFQSSATVGAGIANSGSFYFLFEATTGGVAGIDVIDWSVDIYQNYDGSGSATPTNLSVSMESSVLAVYGSDFGFTGTIAEGDKFVALNGGRTNWGVFSRIDIDGDGIATRTLDVRTEDFGGSTNTSQDFNYTTLTMIGWEIENGEFSSGRYDVTFDALTNNQFIWPAGDLFDVVETVVPIPAAFWLFGSGMIGLIGMARRKTT